MRKIWNGSKSDVMGESKQARSNTTIGTRGRKRFLSTASVIATVAALGVFAGVAPAEAETAATGSQPEQGLQLPPVNVAAPAAKHAAHPAASAKRADRGGAQRQRQRAAWQAEPAPPSKEFLPSQDARTGTVGVYSNSTSVATKTNTPLVDIPQSLSVITREFIRDQSFQNLTDVTR
jgi:catecholate siderophore receptor